MVVDKLTFEFNGGYPGEVYQLHQSNNPDLYYITPLGMIPEGVTGDGSLQMVRIDEIEEAFKSGIWIKR